MDEDSRYSRSMLGICTKILLGLLCLVLIVAIIIPNFVKARTHTSHSACVANLKQIDGAKATWAKEHDKELTDSPLDSDVFGRTKYIPEKSSCEFGGVYILGKVGEPTRCSYCGPGHQL